MRAFLREPSTPWIVFDQEGRPPSQLAVGEVLPVALSSVMPDHRFFPHTAIREAASPQSGAEPSSLAVAADLADPSNAMDESLATGAIPMTGLRRRLLGAAAAGVALVTTLAIGLFVSHGGAVDVHASNALAATAARPALGAPVPADIPPPDLDVAPRAAQAPAPVTVVPAPAPAPAESPARAAAKKFARLSIAGDARSRDVFLDGKRLLGRGSRSFTVMCGTHSIAIGTRTDAHDVDVPCNGELVVGK